MSRRYSPTVRRRRLSAVLRQLRHDRNMTLEGAAAKLEWSRGRLAHMEGNKWTRPDINNVRLLLDLYDVTDEQQREGVLTLARQSRQRGWWQKYSDIFGSDTYVGFESEASGIRTYQSMVIPGLLQTARYAEVSARASLARPTEEAQRIVATRQARQEILDQEDPPLLWAIIDESALHRLFAADDVAREQVEHLITAASNPDNGITLQIMPFSAGLHPGISGPFVILDFPGDIDPSMVYLESRIDSLFLEEPEEVAEYKLVFDHLLAAAKSQRESIEIMENLLTNL